MTFSDTADVRRVLIIRPNHRLGNNVLMTPLLVELERMFPQARVDVLTGGGASHALYKGYSRLGNLHAFPAWSYARPGEVLAIVRRVSREPYDLAIDPVPGSRSARFLLALVDARHKLGYLWGSRWRDATLTHSVGLQAAPRHYGQAPVHLLRTAFGAGAAPMPTLDLRLNAEEKALGHRLLDRALNDTPRPGAHAMCIGLYGAATGAKRYSTGWWLAFLGELQHQLAATPHRLIEFLPHDAESTFAGRIPSLLSVQLRELGAALGALDAFVTADCGVMHLASAAGVRTTGLFKVTDAARYGPYGPGDTSISAVDTAPEAAARAVAERLRDVNQCQRYLPRRVVGR
jgi:heptosyltransferase-3